MGERDLGTTMPRPGGRARLLAPAALLLVLTVLGLMKPLEPPASPRGIAYALGAASLARDFDLRFESEDETRFRDLVVMRPSEVVLAGGEIDQPASFAGDPLGMVYVAPFVAVGGLRGAWFAHSLALALAMAAAASTLRQRVETPWRVLVACLFGSVTLVYLMEPRPEALVLAAVVAAFALAYRSEVQQFETLSEVYDDSATRSGPQTVRWLAIGGLLGFAALHHPIYALLLAAALLAVPVARRQPAGMAMGLGVAIVLGLSLTISLLAQGAFPWTGPLVLYSASTGFPGLVPQTSGTGVLQLAEAAQPVFDLSLAGWNLLFLLIGRSIGVLPYFLPVLLVLALWEPRTGRSTLVAVTALIALATLLVWPFDFAGDSVGLGNAVLLPVFGALWLVPTRRCPAWAAALVVVASGVVLWPTWVATTGLGSAGAVGSVAPIAQRWLPHETTRRLPGRDFAPQETIRVLPAGGGLAERNGRLLLTGGTWGSLVLASGAPLSSVYLAFDGQAGSELEVRGGDLGNTLFGADGGVGFEITLEGAARRHRMWWSAEPQSLYDMSLRLPRAPEVPIAFRVGPNPAGR